VAERSRSPKFVQILESRQSLSEYIVQEVVPSHTFVTDNYFRNLNIISMFKQTIFLMLFLAIGSSLCAQNNVYSNQEIAALRKEVSDFSNGQKELYIQAKKLFNEKLDAGLMVVSAEEYKEIEQRLAQAHARLTHANGEAKKELLVYTQSLETNYISTFQIVQLAKKI